MGFFLQVVDEAEVGFCVLEPVSVLGISGETRVFSFENLVEVGDGGDEGAVDGGVPEGDVSVVAGWWRVGHGGAPHC